MKKYILYFPMSNEPTKVKKFNNVVFLFNNFSFFLKKKSFYLKGTNAVSNVCIGIFCRGKRASLR